MPLRIQASDGGHPIPSVASRVARGDHSLGATGHCQRLLSLVPTIVVKAGDVVVVPYHFALWLVLPTLSIHDDLKTTLWTHEMVGWEFLGAALDELLPLYEGGAAVTPSVLRLSLRKIGDDIRATAANLVVSSADMYEVYTGAIPTAAHKISPAFRKAALALLTVAAVPGAAPCGASASVFTKPTNG